MLENNLGEFFSGCCKIFQADLEMLYCSNYTNAGKNKIIAAQFFFGTLENPDDSKLLAL
jgi:hypothetical protein